MIQKTFRQDIFGEKKGHQLIHWLNDSDLLFIYKLLVFEYENKQILLQ